MLARRASVDVSYQGVNISEEVAKDLLSFEYVDNASGDSDSISLSLQDYKHIWLNDWFPAKGDSINPTIRTTNWKGDGDKEILPCGRFFVDEPSYAGRPSVITFNAISSPLNGNFTGVKRSKSWRNITLSAIASDIANQAGLNLEFYGNNDPLFTDKEQTETSDSAFLSELCEIEGLGMKVTDSKIVIFDEKEFESRPSVLTLKESNSSVLSYSFKTSLAHTTYAGVKVTYYDAKKGQNVEFLYTDSEIEESSKIYQVNEKVDNQGEAIRVAQRTLQVLNKKTTTASLAVVGRVELLGTACVDLEEFGAFSGKYYIEKSIHSIGSGYTVSLEARKVM